MRFPLGLQNWAGNLGNLLIFVVFPAPRLIKHNMGFLCNVSYLFLHLILIAKGRTMHIELKNIWESVIFQDNMFKLVFVTSKPMVAHEKTEINYFVKKWIVLLNASLLMVFDRAFSESQSTQFLSNHIREKI